MIDMTAAAPPHYPLATDGARAQTDVVVLHYTAGYTTASALRAMEARELSVHAVVERDGAVTRCAQDNARCRHAGGSTWGGRSYVNARSLGVELVGFGYVERQYPRADERVFDPAEHGLVEIEAHEGDLLGYRTEGGVQPGTRCPFVWATDDPDLLGENYAVVPDHRHGDKRRGWTVYPEPQLEALVELVGDWLNSYGLPVEAVVGHEHVASGRKLDPGPAFPWIPLYDRLEQVVGRRPQSSTWLHKARVISMQSHLERLECDPGAIDGEVGPRTERAQRRARDAYGALYGFDEVGPDALDARAWCRQLVLVPGFLPARWA